MIGAQYPRPVSKMFLNCFLEQQQCLKMHRFLTAIPILLLSMFHRCAPNMGQTSLSTNAVTVAQWQFSSALGPHTFAMLVMMIFRGWPVSQKRSYLIALLVCNHSGFYWLIEWLIDLVIDLLLRFFFSLFRRVTLNRLSNLLLSVSCLFSYILLHRLHLIASHNMWK